MLKMLYLATERVSKKWTRAYPNWDLVISQLKILFAEVLNKGAYLGTLSPKPLRFIALVLPGTDEKTDS
ncbi:hypothetical protein AXY_04550 [Amphibacillus xylanus NBRC 15112]|uniref:Uncharacterized protein n=1 Tax=Amphibacillus xylanus (strain ATCC 51415 / DSM 6626 / JCM 7361 / LMG 17667 / NBRC 15112 / Ep01) TaxID=698758 RepID=K0J085_AMPXN|nr:hypothetical protein AXY_04550 [Amphibacillus xylanus NBRC 15112]